MTVLLQSFWLILSSLLLFQITLCFLIQWQVAAVNQLQPKRFNLLILHLTQQLLQEDPILGNPIHLPISMLFTVISWWRHSPLINTYRMKLLLLIIDIFLLNVSAVYEPTFSHHWNKAMDEEIAAMERHEDMDNSFFTIGTSLNW